MSKKHHNKTSVERSAGRRDKSSTNLDKDATEIQSARLRADELSQAVDQSGFQKDPLLLEAIAQLQMTLEELQVADEELRQQHEELLATRTDLELEQQRYKDLFDSAPDGYIITDGFGKILDANRAATTLLGVEGRFLLGKPLLTYVQKADHPALHGLINRLSKSDTSDIEKADIRICPRAAEPFHAAVRIAVSHNSKLNGVKLRWLMRDITERVCAQEAIRAMNEELEEKVKQRTAELEQANLLRNELFVREQQARADAEAANRSKDEFLAIVSHELRTPLNSILGWAQIMNSEKADESQRARAAEVIERSALTQARIISDILDVSRIVTGNLTLDLSPVSLHAVIEAAIEAARPSIEANTIILKTDLESIGPVEGDFARLQQVVGNMLSNSIKFTPARGRIEIKLRSAGDQAELMITDTGDGISREFLPHVFEQFRQAEVRATRRQGGLGLGLAIVSNLIKMHGGTVDAASDGEGQGATFTVRLPLAASTSTESKANIGPSQTHQQSAALEGVWIVVVDDDADAREMMRTVLGSAGARVTACGSCEEALALFSEKSTGLLKSARPQILISDIAMPGQDGFDLIRAVRKLSPERGGAIPAIALTADATDKARSKALAEGYQMHLAKPAHLEDLVEAVARLHSERDDQEKSPTANKAAVTRHQAD